MRRGAAAFMMVEAIVITVRRDVKSEIVLLLTSHAPSPSAQDKPPEGFVKEKEGRAKESEEGGGSWASRGHWLRPSAAG